jgi:uncharacterized RDD family membrane protein YckC
MTQQTSTQALLACSQCGQTFAQSDLVQIAGNWVCGACKPAFLSRVMAGTASAAQWHYGGFWMRLAARMIDGLALSAVYLPIFFWFGLRTFRAAMGTSPGKPPQLGTILQIEVGFVLAALGLWLVYEVPMLRYWGATLGKMACGLKVVRPDGRGLSWGMSLGRYFMYDVVTAGVPYVNGLLSLISSIMVGVDDEKRALHDRVCDTRVVYKQTLARV